MEGPNKKTPEKIAGGERSRTISDGDLLKGGAEYVVSDDGGKRLVLTNEQKRDLDLGMALEEKMSPLKARFTPFLNRVFSRRYTKEVIENTPQKPSFLSPAAMRWDLPPEGTLGRSSQRFGEYTVNPKTVYLTEGDFELIEKEGKIETLPIFELSEFVGKPIMEVTQYVAKTYNNPYHETHYIPGIEYAEYIINNPDKNPSYLKGGDMYYFLGSIFSQSVLSGGGQPVTDAKVLSAYFDGDERQYELKSLRDDKYGTGGSGSIILFNK